MKALAEFAMRSRVHAIGVSAVSAALPPPFFCLSAGVASLVMLRKGPVEGALVTLWAVLPAMIWYVVGDPPDPTNVILILGTVSLAYVLRATLSWALTLGAAIFVGIVAGFSFEFAASELLLAVPEVFLKFNPGLQPQFRALGTEAVTSLVVGAVATGQVFLIVMLLALGRWWQSTLVSPGSFQKEFHGLRLPPKLSAAITIVALLCFLSGAAALTRWTMLIMVPLVVSGIAFVHWLIKAREWAAGVLIAFYVVVALLPQALFPVLAILSVADSAFDLRPKMNTKAGPPASQQ